MMIEIICNNLFLDPGFQADYNALMFNAIAHHLGLKKKPQTETAIANLLRATSFFAESENKHKRLLAYEIATSIYTLYQSDFNGIKSILYCVLSKLGNFPAIQYFNHTLEIPKELPTRLSFLSIHHQQANMPQELEGIALTDYQQQVWKTLNQNKSVILSAPTSAGKSFIAQQYLFSKIKKKEVSHVLYIVPTRALINQVQAIFSQQFQKELFNQQLFLSSTPVLPEFLNTSQFVFIFTQERLELFLNTYSDITFDIIIVDEAQLINDPNRGVKLESMLQRVLRPKTLQVIFISPKIINPEKFQNLFNTLALNVIPIPEPTVSQNLILIDIKPSDVKNLHIRFKTDTIQGLGTIPLDYKLVDEKHFLPHISAKLGLGAANLIYGTGKAECEKIAISLKQLLPAPSPEKQKELLQLTELVKTHIHSDYILADVLSKGIAFHYGTMPAIVRKNIEKAFENKIIDFLICTSTLLHGVNLPAKNLFIMKPTKGICYDKSGPDRKIPLTAAEFWNLAGRVGRLGKEFSGNIFLINYDDWQNKALDQPDGGQVDSAVATNIENAKSDFLTYINSNTHISKDNKSMENTFMKLFIDYLSGTLENTLAKIHTDEEYKNKIRTRFAQIKSNITLPLDVLKQNSSISVFKQERLYNYLQEKIIEGKIESVIPVHPRSEGKKVSKSLREMFRRIGQNIDGLPPTNKSFAYHAALAYSWILGKPLPQIIDEVYAEKSKKSTRKPNIQVVIRDTLEDIETELRFRLVNNTSCYISILRHLLVETGNEQYLESVSSIPLYLEVGASSITMINLMNLGFSRTASATLAEIIPNSELDEANLRRWFLENNTIALLLPAYVQEEILDLHLSK